MCSARGFEGVPDLTSKARIRDAAIECFASNGDGCTVRMVAEKAGVSPGLVIHHYRTMEGLRTACDEHIAALIRDMKGRAMSVGPSGLDVIAALRNSGFGHAGKYLAQMLADDSPAAARLVDDLIDDAEEYLEEGVASGLLRPTDHPRGRAVVLGLWSMSALVLHHHFERLLGVDFTDPDIGADPILSAYLQPAYDILGNGVFTKEAMAHLTAAAEQMAAAAEEATAQSTDMRGIR